MKVRIFALAKDLGLDSKELIQHCNDAGIAVKNSALASISPEERDLVLDHMKQLGSAKSAAPESKAVDAPVREQAGEGVGKVRQIQTLGPLGRAIRRTKGEEEPEPEEVAETTTEPVEVEAAPTSADDAETVTASVEEEDSKGDEESEITPPAPPPASGDGGAAKPISKEDYVSPVGGGSTILREMKPVASVSDSGSKSSRKASRKSSLPNIAPLPNFKPPTLAKGKAEPAAQKPDLPLTKEALTQNSPLANIIRKKAEVRKRDDDFTEDGGRPGTRPSRLGSLDDLRSRRVKRTRRQQDDDTMSDVRISRPKGRRKQRGGNVDLKTSATVEVPISIRALSEELGRPAKDIMGVMMRSGKFMKITDELDEEAVLEVGLELGIDIEIQHETDIEDVLTSRFEDQEIPEDATIGERPPIVTILGHVDHGKTTLLDKIRSANVAAGEAGGITQHISSYQVEHNGKPITFVDTPGHAAFGEMRARGANVTDIIVLVVAADDGVMPQTVECISHAKAAGVPIIVALNKCDLPDINEQRILTELSQHDVLPSEWGGDIEVVRVSALEGIGIDNLLETILLTAELQEFKGPVDTPAVGVCLEAFLDEGRGPIAWLIVRDGTLHLGDIALCGSSYGRIRAMYNDRDESIETAPPSTPVRVAGLDDVPGAGDHFYVMPSLDEAREAASVRHARGRDAALVGRGGGPLTLEKILAGAGTDGGVRELPLIIKADSPGSIEAIRSELSKLDHPEVRVKILHEGVGGVNESDVYLASSAGAIIVAFHVIAEDRASTLAERESVEVRRYNIIYELTDHIRMALEGLLEPDRVEVATGRALVLQTFHISRFGTIAGCRILNGTIERNNRVHVIRDQKIINDYPIASLKRDKDDVREVREGFECGIRLDGFNDIKEGDLLEAFRVDEVKRSLDR
ncbi:MAG: translation initiation factor IF-2 [Planctomycetaceae bacterium]|nr:translation initiation factor IF-2 [Planctomycetaceae bacterium]